MPGHLIRSTLASAAMALCLGRAAAGDVAAPTDPEEMSAGWWFAEESGAVAWSEDASSLGGSLGMPGADGLINPASVDSAATLDGAVEPSQFLATPPGAPSFRPPMRTTQTATRPATRAAATTSLASIPYMIGDTGAGTCIGFDGLVTANLSHPTLACSRLNVAEANTPLPTDRFYYSYRHFENANEISAYQFSETLNLDTHTLAWENTFWDRTGSLEIRVPIEQRMQSDIFSIIVPGSGIVDPLVSPTGGRDVELGNISLIFKMLLLERENFALSGGLGVTLPTAKDVNYNLAVAGEVVFPNEPGVTALEAVAFKSVFANETVYLSPFLAWGYAPSRWFHQGFLQFEVAANPSQVTVNGDGATTFFDGGGNFIGFYDYFTPVPVQVDLFSQTLMRLNLGWGYILSESRDSDRYRQWAGLFELHYTTTLQDANLSNVPLTTLASGGTVPLQTITIGNQDNRVDLLNVAVGTSATIDLWMFTVGVIAPIRDCPDCGFDVEYNAQVQRRF